jgi:hypothetical protein
MPSIDTLQIGPWQFNVYYKPDLKNRKGEDVDGHLDHGQGCIDIDAELTDQAKLHTLLHEIIHERLEIQCGHDLGEYAEQMIDAIGFMWIEIMRDNPKLVRMITK